MVKTEVHDLLALLDNSVKVEDGSVTVLNQERLRDTIHRLVEVSVKESGTRQGLARYITRLIALEMGIIPSSIHDLYIARGRGEVPPTFTVPAMNLRVLSFDAARAVFRTAMQMDAGAFIFEIARSEIGYTDQRPAEYTTNVLAAAIVEGYTGPVFIQGDHFQVSGKRFAANPEQELEAVRDLTREAIQAGFYNIDIDTSTLVDLSKDTIREQQEVNTQLSAMLTAFIRGIEPPGVTISVGGEIGEVGGQNSTEPELRGYMDGYNQELENLAPGTTGLSKISIQTGTSHGGVILPDGSIADVNVDFDTLLRLSQVARLEYGLAGAVQHGASTLPQSAFGKFAESEACEVHLATNFQTMAFERLPSELKAGVNVWLDQNHASDRKEGMTDEQFYYKTRKNAIGPFKQDMWNMPAENRDEIREAWEETFTTLFDLLGIRDTRKYVDQTIKPVVIKPSVKDYLGEAVVEEDVSDLAD
jgi:fructose-bisphosphate aldolase, class II